MLVVDDVDDGDKECVAVDDVLIVVEYNARRNGGGGGSDC